MRNIEIAVKFQGKRERILFLKHVLMQA